MKKEYSMNINLKCPVCADLDFVVEDDKYVCNSCGVIYDHAELIEQNTEEIDLSKKELIDQFKKDFQRELVQTFKNSKVFKVKK